MLNFASRAEKLVDKEDVFLNWSYRGAAKTDAQPNLS